GRARSRPRQPEGSHGMKRTKDLAKRGITRREFIELTAVTSAVALVGCGDDGSSQPAPVTVAASAPQRVDACATIDLQAVITGKPKRITWTSESDQLLTVDTLHDETASVRAPCVVVDTPLRFRVDV